MITLKNLFLLILLVSSFASATAETAILNALNQLIWKNRIILIWPDENQNADTYAGLLQAREKDIENRHIFWFVMTDSQILTNYPGPIAKNFSDKTQKDYVAEEGDVLLLGKDGGIKSRTDQLLLDALFARIDTMPMRQREMRLQGE